MNTFSSIIITNVTTQTVVKTLPFTEANEKLADQMTREHNITNPHMGMLSVKYAK